MRHLTTLTAVAALALAAAACSKPANQASTDNTTAANTEAANTEASSGGSPMNNTSSAAGAKSNDAVDVAQDSASAVVGPLSAATAGSLSASAFVDNAAQSDMYEIQAAKIAEVRSKTPAVRKFAAEMIAAHTKTTAELKAIVTGGKAGDAKLPTALDNRRQGLIDNLKSASQDDFDARYLDQQQAGHREAEILMKGYSTAGSNADLKAFAKKTAPIVTEHTKMAENLDRGNADKDNKTGDAGQHG